MESNNDQKSSNREVIELTRIMESFPLKRKGEYWFDAIAEYNEARNNGSIVFTTITLSIPVCKKPPSFFLSNGILEYVFLLFQSSKRRIVYSFEIDPNPKRTTSDRDTKRIAFFITEKTMNDFEQAMRGFSPKQKLSWSLMPEHVTSGSIYKYRIYASLHFIEKITIHKQ